MENSITFKKAKVTYFRYGTGKENLVLLHGFLENSSMWELVIEEFSARYNIICVDLLGHGNSECVGYVHTMEDIAASVYEVLKAENINRASFIGHSMGGYVALALAEQYPDCVGALCLLNSTSQADAEERKQIRNRAIQMAKTNYSALVSMSIQNLFASETNKQFQKEIEECKKQALATQIQGYIACSEGMKLRKNREVVLKEGSFEKLIITGEKDPVLAIDAIKSEANRTNTSIVTLSKGHMSHIENSKELLSSLKDLYLN
ncbi:alpha/beta fold hydrolase [Tenacibaculum agarivorans]|uniref:alpha/beta fold hydrolase n=1 Tax=Tenacibaculum agarivorans TaxID=1908389 RepID=UPI00094B9C8B|nr:alpha/beta hydrolase [Tenacibaculum agarivorans]